MKWATFISFIFLVSSTEAKHLPRRTRDAVGGFCFIVSEEVPMHTNAYTKNKTLLALKVPPDSNLVLYWPIDTIGHSYSEIPSDDFKGIALVSFVHYVPNITYEDAKKMVEDITELGKKCAADEHAVPECSKSIDILIPEELCHEQSVAEHYGFSECCGKGDHEKNECLLSHRNATSRSFPPYQRPEAEAACKAFQENRLDVLGKFLFKVSRKAADTSILILFHSVAQFEEVMEACCQREDKEACLSEKAAAIKKELEKNILLENQNCFLLKKFGPKHLQTVKFVMAAQKYPKAERSILHNISREIVHIHEERCRGNTVESYLDQIALTKFVCGHQDAISLKVKGCCEKNLLHRPFCLVTMEHDDPPADLSPTVREFVDNKDVCHHYAENHDDHLERFAYEYSRRHPELSFQLLLRLVKGYHDLLEKCCKLESPEACLAEGEPLLRKHIADTLEVIRTNCELHATLGDAKFKNALLVRYSKKAPQLSFEELYQYAEQLTAVAAKCCQLGDDKKLVCAEGYADIVLGSICMQHQEHPINPKICQCCSNNYAFRRECFSAIEVDDGYVPASCSQELFTLHEDLCTANADMEKRKSKLLVNLVKCKPAITGEQLKAVVTDFYEVVARCCQAENHEQCFQEEGPKLVQRTQAALS